MLAARIEQKNGMTKGRQKWRDAPLTKKAPYKPDAGDRHVRFDERGWETGRCQMAQATAPILDSLPLAPIEPTSREVGLVPCMDGARGARGNQTFQRAGRVQPCIRPWNAAPLAL